MNHYVFWVIRCVVILLVGVGLEVKGWIRRIRLAVKSSLNDHKISPNLEKFIGLLNDSRVERPHGDNLILLDVFPIPQWLMVNSVLANELASMHSSRIASFGMQARTIQEDMLYSSFGARSHFIVGMNSNILIATFRDCFFALKKISSPNDLFNYSLRGVRVGEDIYESILRGGNPTVRLSSFRFYTNLYLGFLALNYYEQILNRNEVRAILLSHDSYIGIGLLGRLGHIRGIEVFHANPYEIIRVSRPHQIYERFIEYPSYFAMLDQAEKSALLMNAKAELNSRLNGAVGVGMPHQEKSAYSNSTTNFFENRKSRKAVIASHCFFDNPHGYGRMIFNDFFEWLNFLGENTIGSNLEWFIKCHPDYLPGTLEILEGIVTKYPHITLLPPEISFHELKNSGVEAVLTCYGSVGHELPGIGIPVINCGYNPHIAYSFNHHCATRQEIIDLLCQLEMSPIINQTSGLEEFYVVNNFLMRPDDFFFPSMKQYLSISSTCGERYDVVDFIAPIWSAIIARFTLRVADFLKSAEINSSVHFLRKGDGTS